VLVFLIVVVVVVESCVVLEVVVVVVQKLCEVQASTGAHCNKDLPLTRASRAHKHRLLHSGTKTLSRNKCVRFTCVVKVSMCRGCTRVDRRGGTGGTTRGSVEVL
jgi:hypothetical protein